MTETIISTNALHEVLSNLISTEKVCVKQEDDGIIQLVPVKEKKKYAVELCGILSDCPEMTVDKFLERKRAEKELEL